MLFFMQEVDGNSFSGNTLVNHIKYGDSRERPQLGFPTEGIQMIHRDHLREHATAPPDEGTHILLVRNASDSKNRALPENSDDFGALDEGQAAQTAQETKETFDKILGLLSPEEKAKVDILVVASDASLHMPDGKKSPHKRGVETAQAMMQGIRDSLAGNNVSENQLLNTEASQGKPVEVTGLRDLRMLDESPAFVEYLKEKCKRADGTVDYQQFWSDYESDTYREKRIELGAEGPEEIAKRVDDFLSVLQMASYEYHKGKPGRKLIIVGVTHYDSLSPYLKKRLNFPMDKYFRVEYGGGVALTIPPIAETKKTETSVEEDYSI